MDKMDEKLEKAAQQMESFFKKSEMKQLYETIKTLGKEGLKKALPKLNESQKSLLKEVLAKGPEAASMDDKMPEGGVKVKQWASEPVKGARHDDKDEELMEEKNAEVRHQGDASPEGFEGQKIEDPSPEKKGKVPADEKPAVDGRATPSERDPVMAKSDMLGEKSLKNPDEKQDAELGEKIEADVEQHMEENKEAEKEEGHEMAKHVPGVPDAKFDSCIKDVKKEGSADNAYAVCTASLKKGETMFSSETAPEPDKKDDKKPETEGGQELYSDDILHKMIHGMKGRGIQKHMAMDKFYKHGYSMDKMYKMWDNVEYKSPTTSPAGRIETSALDKSMVEHKEPLLFAPETKAMTSPLMLTPEEKKMSEPLSGKSPTKTEPTGAELCPKCGKGKDECICAKEAADKKESKAMEKSEKKTPAPEKKLEKSVKWNRINLLAASTRRGQNSHYDVADLILSGDKSRSELKKGQYLQSEGNEEVLAKSEGQIKFKETDLNDLIEKGLDRDWTEVEAQDRLTKSKSGDFRPLGVDESEIIKTMSPEQIARATNGLKKKSK